MRPNTKDNTSHSFVEPNYNERMTNQELHDLVYNHQKFLQSVQNLNDSAESHIRENNFSQALLLLTQAQQILQYAASCGKNIDRSLIISVLHNQACVYQKLWELIRCSNYLEALIFNMNDYLSLEEPRMVRKNILTMSACNPNYIDKSLRLVKYYLQFAAINSQIKNHSDAYQQSKKAINLLKLLFSELKKSFSRQKQSESITPLEPRQSFELKGKILQSVSKIPQQVNLRNLEDYISSTQYFYHIWKKNKTLNQHQGFQDKIKGFSIGKIMQIQSFSDEQGKQGLSLQNNIYFTNDSISSSTKKFDILRSQTYQKIIEKIIILSISYFTLSTQLRLSSQQKYSVCLETWKNSPQYKESQIYHLYSLMLIFAYIPFEMLFVNHSISSYKKNYQPQTQLFKDDNIDLFEKGIEYILKIIDSQSVHLFYNYKKTEPTQKTKKCIEILPHSSSNISSKTGSNSKSKRPVILRLQKKCKKIISDRYYEDESLKKLKNKKKKHQFNKSATYLNKRPKTQRPKTQRSQKSKKSFSISKKQGNNKKFLNFTGLYIPKKMKKSLPTLEHKDNIQELKKYYDSILPIVNQKSDKTLKQFKSPSHYKKDIKNKNVVSKKNKCEKGKREEKSKGKKLKEIKSSKTLLLKKELNDETKKLRKNPSFCKKTSIDGIVYFS